MNRRPSSRTSKGTYEEAKVEIIKVLNRCKALDGEDVEEAFECICGHYDVDGYALAKRLDEECSWSPVTEDVDELDDIGQILYEALQSRQKNWVKENNIIVPFKIGDVVSFEHGAPMTGTIIRIIEDTAKIVVEVKGKQGNPIVNFEDAKLEVSGKE